MPIRESPNGARDPCQQAGRDRPEWVVAINRNSWSRSPGARTGDLLPLPILQLAHVYRSSGDKPCGVGIRPVEWRTGKPEAPQPLLPVWAPAGAKAFSGVSLQAIRGAWRLNNHK
jgi:hypothetical protein